MAHIIRKTTTTIRPDHFLNTQETCRKLDVTRMTLHRWVKMGRIKPFIRAGRGKTAAWVFMRDDVKKMQGVKGLHWKRPHNILARMKGKSL